uniref:Uncharacterized protein n=1 Tax=Physcomitrium patens TaxID=3218 RepID=A0A2K1JKD8_PHYPA|nr:hypothetical protein PHYPA_016852 [Physcomitrium patens]
MYYACFILKHSPFGSSILNGSSISGCWIHALNKKGEKTLVVVHRDSHCSNCISDDLACNGPTKHKQTHNLLWSPKLPTMARKQNQSCNM